MTAQTENEPSESDETFRKSMHWQGSANDGNDDEYDDDEQDGHEQDDDGDHVGVEELGPRSVLLPPSSWSLHTSKMHQPATGPIYVYVQTINQLLRLLPIRNEEPFHGLSGRFLFIGYVGHVHQLLPIYWPEEYLTLAHPPHGILQHVGFLLVVNDTTRFSIYEIENGGSTFLNDCRTNFCTPNLHGGISPIWMSVFRFTPATYPDGYPPPAPHIPVNIPTWETSFPQSLSSLAPFSQIMFHQSLDFEYEPTLIELTSVFDYLPTPTLPDDENSALASINAQPFMTLKAILAASPWGRSIKLAKYLFIGHLLVGIPENSFVLPEDYSRQLIMTSFLRALRFNQKTYNELTNEHLTIENKNGSETTVGWSYLRNWFADFYIEITSEIRKITQASTSPLTEFAVNEERKMQKILELIVGLNSGDQRLVQNALSELIATQAFREVLWVALLRPIAELAEGNARLADLYPDAIQTWMGYL
ncbi:uncharacterized protein F5147DRAFT_781149 [Suillus discolor]|uniref:Uncharacterized protein n=1 Tax=Suillus discolor TaxID=1912936 RepID=A0A9P7ESP6_9AGAM|nr:uncharacterized protein F5147DRAFT_781149 [Suillus discolor]KAG2088018.1 hypothetical protein F5147DRAFT_781149 [Suillus discolor]